MSKELTCNVLVLDSDGQAVLLEQGSTVPSGYADQVGDHCYAADSTEPVKARRARSTDSE